MAVEVTEIADSIHAGLPEGHGVSRKRSSGSSIASICNTPRVWLGLLSSKMLRQKCCATTFKPWPPLEARGSDELPSRERINRTCLHTALKPLLPALLLGKKVAKMLRNVLTLIAKRTCLHRENLSKPRKTGPKPHKHMSQKHC